MRDILIHAGVFWLSVSGCVSVISWRTRRRFTDTTCSIRESGGCLQGCSAMLITTTCSLVVKMPPIEIIKAPRTEHGTAAHAFFLFVFLVSLLLFVYLSTIFIQTAADLYQTSAEVNKSAHIKWLVGCQNVL